MNYKSLFCNILTRNICIQELYTHLCDNKKKESNFPYKYNNNAVLLLSLSF